RELLGLRQHGATPLVAADLHRDGALLERARKDAIELLAADPQLRDDRFARLRRVVLRRYGTTLHLSDAGWVALSSPQRHERRRGVAELWHQPAPAART